MILFPKPRATYLVWAPSWAHISSGVRALHLLCHALNEAGEKAYILPTEPDFEVNPQLNTPLVSEISTGLLGSRSSGLDYVVVYPDIVRGNPLDLGKVVRYLLAPAGAYGGDASFPTTDKVYGYTRDIHDKVLCVPTFDPGVFYPPTPEEQRVGAVFYSHKYDRIHKHPLLGITDGAKRVEGTPGEVAGMLRKAEVCYVYERSEISVLARMCGCRVAPVITDYYDGSVPEEFVRHDGVLLPQQALMVNFLEQLREFIRDTQTWTT